MWESLAPWLIQTGGVGLMVVVAMSRDWLISHRSHMREISLLDRIIKDRDETLRIEREISAELRRQLGTLLGRRIDEPASR